MSNKCTRCGKERVIIKTYKEKVGDSFVIYKEMACPDPACQSKVDRVLSNEKDKRTLIRNEQDKREKERKERIADSRKNNNS